ncbi:hypothetical protein Tco_1360530 [Tanacetum coccineum]
MHNNIMAAGSKERPPMLRPGRYSQWRSHFLRYIDMKPNGEGLRKSILFGPYVPSTVLVQAVAATEGVPAVQQHTTIETMHMRYIYSTVGMLVKQRNEIVSITIERLQQGESLNVQDVKTNLFWEFGKFTSRDGESMESYYSRSTGIGMQKNLALLAKYFKRLSITYQHKPLNFFKLSGTTDIRYHTKVPITNDNQSEAVWESKDNEVVGAGKLIAENERAALANLIANLTLDTEENKTILKQLKKANASLTQELEE